MVRTTVAVDDRLLESARALARDRGTTLGRVVEDALRRELARDDSRPAPSVPTFTRGNGMVPGLDVRSNRALAEVVDPAQEAGLTPHRRRGETR